MKPAVGAGGWATAFNRLRFGLAKNPSTRALDVIEQFLDAITVLPVDRAIERPYGSLRATLERAGHPIGCLDTIIATHALAHA
jgi:tRNA(fMet)-specific endonuclease VapC